MKLSELISKYGDDNIKLQNLDKCATSLNYDRKKGTQITFATDIPLDLRGTQKMGLVIWFDREKVQEILK